MITGRLTMPDTTCPRCHGYRKLRECSIVTPGDERWENCDLCGGTGQYTESDKIPKVVDSLMDALEADGLPVVRDDD